MKFSSSSLLLGTGLLLSLAACKKDDEKKPATPAPTITAIAPNSAPVGTAVTITGTDLTGATAVMFNTTAATTFTVTNATTITATVPAGATTGAVKVTTPAGTATSAMSFTVVTVTAPTVTAVAPTTGGPGTVVTISGTNLTGATVAFNGTPATTVTVVNATTVTAVVPTGATTGALSVTTPNGTATSPTPFTVGGITITVPAGDLTGNVTWLAINKYILTGTVRVPDGATLTIEPGTIIKGDKATKGSLVVMRGGRLIANGTASQPIVFTSNQPKGSRAPGDWGGVVICGKAPVNFTGGEGTAEGFDVPIAYGGTDANDNSGSLKYVRIEFAGIALTPGNEINGLTLAGVGAGTTLDHIQVIYGGDDAFEFFGGTVNAKYLIAARTTDDMFDTDNGYSGKVQFALGIADPNLSDQAGASNGFESDNDANGSANTPQTRGIFANVTLVGPQATTGATLPAGGSKYGVSALIRRNSALSLYNVVMAGWPKGLNIDNASLPNYTNGTLQVMGTVIAGVPSGLEFVNTGTDAIYNTAANKNAVLANNADLQLNPNAFTLTAPGMLPATGSPLLDASKAAALPGGFDAAAFRGAFGTDNWTAGWTNWDPQNTDY